MTAYTCEKCGMGVAGMTCAKCGKALVHDVLTKPDGSEVHVSKCPDDCGMIKSPMCCGADMSCSLGG
ncbi:MAG: hypothetical protein CL928_18950 [Deltaproteobacteria bacterium]|nr:hypothetical protein [Deltaproteobacteria bacterium]